MKTKKRLACTLVFALVFFKVNFSQYAILIGPTIHFNIGAIYHTSLGIEASWWNLKHVPYGFDLGVEFEKSNIRVYTEGQTGVYLAGFAAGPVMQFNSDSSSVKLGLQGSFWANFFLGTDVRVRHIDGHNTFCPGIYFKLPVAADFDDGDDNHSRRW